MFLKKIIKDGMAFLKYYLPKRRYVSVLMYHSISNNNVFFTVQPIIFARQMKFLKEEGYNVISLAEMINVLNSDKPLPKKTIILTFDDGYEDNHFNAWPILKKYGFPATVFVAPKWQGEYLKNSQKTSLKIMNWAQMREMRTNLIDFQPHGFTHEKLDKLSLDEIRTEIRESKRTIEEQLEKKCCFFSYPHGRYNQKIIQILKENNFKAGFTVNHGFIKKKDNLFTLSRNSINSTVSFIQFKSKL